MDDTQTVVREHDGRLLARMEADDRVFEVNLDEVDATDVTLRLYRDGEQVGSIYNDFGTAKTMARLTVPESDTGDFMGFEVPKSFVGDLLDLAVETGRVRDEDAVDGYRLRVL